MKPNIVIIDGMDIPHPEDRAMLQALYSRSPAPVSQHIERVMKAGSGAFMSQYYVGYGHESIGELGDITIFIEGVSMAAAKAFQDNPLYRGQECSTRYIDFSNQPMLKTENAGFNSLMEQWRQLYIKALPVMEAWVRTQYSPEFVLPKDTPSEKIQALYDKTVKAITFDYCSGLLPIGATTSVAWSGDLRTIATHLRKLIIHSLTEARTVARNLYEQLRARYPNSFAVLDEAVLEKAQRIQPNRYNELARSTFLAYGTVITNATGMWTSAREAGASAFDKDMLPYMDSYLKDSVKFEFNVKIDYAAYRDLQRHRPGYLSLALPTPMSVMEPWYTAAYLGASSDLFEEVMGLWNITLAYVNRLSSEYLPDYQYVFPMLATVDVEMHWNLHQTIYVANLRSGVTVRPTLRKIAKEIALQVTNNFRYKPIDYLFRLDEREDYQATRRGSQDIVEK